MAVDSTTDGAPLIELDDEIDGDEVGSRNYRFAKIGEPVPINSGGTSAFHPGRLPHRPLAVSERFRLLFVAHPQGFYVTRTKDVMASAEDIKEKQAGPSVQESSLVDVSVGEVSVLALSADESVLAACMATHVHFFAVSALLHKDNKPSYSVSLDESIRIKDFCWAKKASKAYIILAADGKLYCGFGQGSLSCMVEDVDAVDWSVKGNFLAVAKKNRVSILSSQFKEKLSFLLQLQLVTGDSDVNQVIKVDSIKWIRSDCIAVGCFQINEDGEEENYIVQVITNKGRRITDVSGSSKPTVLSFNNLFMDFNSDAVPAKKGPHLLLSYLNHCGLAFVANRNLSQRVGLFCWSLDNGTNEVATVEILNDAWNLYIDSQDAGDENVIVGLSVDKVSQNENVTFTLGDKETEISPCCIILCLTIDGKISVYHFASAAVALVAREGCPSDEEDDDSKTPTKHELHLRPADDEECREPTSTVTDSCELGRTEAVKSVAEASITENLSRPFQDVRSQEQTIIESTAQRPHVHPQTVQMSEQKKTHPVLLNNDNNEENGSAAEVKNGMGSIPGKGGGDLFHQSISKQPLSSRNMEPLGKVQPTSSESVWSLPKSNARIDASKTSDERLMPHAYNVVDNPNKDAFQSAGGVLRHPTDIKEKEKLVTFSSFGQTSSTGMGNRNLAPAYTVPQLPFGNSAALGKSLQPEYKKGLYVTSSTTGPASFARTAPKQFANVEEMAKKLDSLLESIEGKGGFRDALITSQTQCLAGLEEDIWALSDRCSISRELMENRLQDVQLLFDKMIQVLVTKVYMEGIFKQAKDSRYWELWNRQKLSSELELKRRRILQLNQELTSKLIELERHFNSLELNKFGENGGIQHDRRVLQNWQGQSRKIQSLYSLHNTIQAQLAAAEQLSGCLSEQMAALSIESSGKQHLKKQLFECIGLSYKSETPRSLARERTFGTPSKTEHSITSGAFTAKEQAKRNSATVAKSEEPETARRRRDSLDHSWASFDPPKTTVKRVQKDKYEKGSANQSFPNIGKPYPTSQVQNKSDDTRSALLNFSGASMNHVKTKGSTEIPAEQSSKNSSASVYQKPASIVDRGLHVSSSKPLPPTLEMRYNENRELGGASKLIDEKSKSSLAFAGKTDPLAASASKFVHKSDTSSHSSPSISGRLPEHLLAPPSASSENVDSSKIGFTMSTWDQKNPVAASETPLFGSKSPIAPSSIFSSGLNASEKGLFARTAEKPSKSDDGQSASTPSQSIVGPSLLSSSNLSSISSFVSKPSSSPVFPATPSSGSTVTARQEASQSLASVPSTLNFPSVSPSSTHLTSNSSGSLSSGAIKSESLTSLSHPPAVMNGSKGDDTSQIQTSVFNVPSKTGKDDQIQAPASQPGLSVSVSNLKLGLSASSSPPAVSDVKSGNQIGVSSSSKSSTVVTLDTKLELPQTTASPIAQSTEGIVGSVKNVISDVSNEEEMEEEAPEAQQMTEFAIGNLGGFGIGTTNSTMPKSNPFGVGALKQDSSTPFPLTMPSSSGELFRPASFSFQSPQTGEPVRPAVSFSGGFGSGNPGQVSPSAGFGQPANIGSGQQALGSVLGTFGQSRQLGVGLPGSNVASAGGFGSGFSGISGGAFGGGFTSAPSGGGFAGLAAGAGGFGAPTTAGGGFAAAATAGGGFGAAATAGGGFAAVAGAGGGFTSSSAGGAMSGGGFGAFGNQQQQGGGGFSAFGGGGTGTGTGIPTSQLFTQMRK